MEDSVRVCAHCRRNFEAKLSNDILLLAHWVDEYYLIDVALCFEGSSRCLVLYRRVYVLDKRA